jgi:hypothetical protein
MKKAKSPQIAGFFVLLLFLFTGGEAAGFTIYSKRSGEFTHARRRLLRFCEKLSQNNLQEIGHVVRLLEL